MAFLIYMRTELKGKDVLFKTSETYSLAGYNLIRTIWEQRGKPINQGWSVDVNELIHLRTNGNNDSTSMRFLIDFHPSSKNRIGIIELLKVYAYTYGDHKTKNVYWTPMMFIARDVFYQEYDNEISHDKKERLIRKFNAPNYGDHFVEFLYLNGDKYGWNWGSNGRTNAAFIEGKAREYFREFF